MKCESSKVYRYHGEKLRREKAITKTRDLLSVQAPNGQYGCAVWVRRNDLRKLHNCQALLPLARLPASEASREKYKVQSDIQSRAGVAYTPKRRIQVS